jgi:hypothetical protein
MFGILAKTSTISSSFQLPNEDFSVRFPGTQFGFETVSICQLPHTEFPISFRETQFVQKSDELTNFRLGKEARMPLINELFHTRPLRIDRLTNRIWGSDAERAAPFHKQMT